MARCFAHTYFFTLQTAVAHRPSVTDRLLADYTYAHTCQTVFNGMVMQHAKTMATFCLICVWSVHDLCGRSDFDNRVLLRARRAMIDFDI